MVGQTLEAGRRVLQRFLPECGIPQDIFSLTVESLAEAYIKDDEIKSKLLSTLEWMSKKPVVLLTGGHSKTKEAFAALLLYYFASCDRKVYYMIAPEVSRGWEPPTAQAIAVVFPEMVNGLGVPIMKSFLSAHLAARRELVLLTKDTQSVETVYGVSFADLVSSMAVEVKFKQGSRAVPEIV